MRKHQAIRTLLAATAIVASSAAFAHPRLVTSTPADKAEIAAPGKIELVFSERLLTDFSGAKLLMTGMPGMPGHGPMNMALTVSGGPDGKTMVITPTHPLAAGTYRVEWRAVSSDTHPMTGHISFEVK